MPKTPKVPPVLYFVTVYFDNGVVRTPNLFVKTTPDEAFSFANKFLVEDDYRYRKMSARKLEFVKTFEITPDFYREVSPEEHRDWSGEFNQELVSAGIEKIPNVLVVILTGKAPGVRGTSYFLDEWYPTTDVSKAINLMKKSSLPLFIPARFGHLYRPLEEIHWSGWN